MPGKRRTEGNVLSRRPGSLADLLSGPEPMLNHPAGSTFLQFSPDVFNRRVGGRKRQPGAAFHADPILVRQD